MCRLRTAVRCVVLGTALTLPGVHRSYHYCWTLYVLSVPYLTSARTVSLRNHRLTKCPLESDGTVPEPPTVDSHAAQQCALADVACTGVRGAPEQH